jgi:hypothetical protein
MAGCLKMETSAAIFHVAEVLRSRIKFEQDAGATHCNIKPASQIKNILNS